MDPCAARREDSLLRLAGAVVLRGDDCVEERSRVQQDKQQTIVRLGDCDGKLATTNDNACFVAKEPAMLGALVSIRAVNVDHADRFISSWFHRELRLQVEDLSKASLEC